MGFQEWSPTPQGEYPYVPPSTLNTYEHAFQGSRLRPAHIGDSSCYAAARAQIRRHRHRTSPVLQPLQRTGPSASESRVVFTVSVMCTGGVPRSAANCCVRPSVLCVLRVRLSRPAPTYPSASQRCGHGVTARLSHVGTCDGPHASLRTRRRSGAARHARRPSRQRTFCVTKMQRALPASRPLMDA